MKEKIKELKEKINAFFEKLDDKQLYYVFGGILLFIFLLDYLILMRPQLSSLSKINPEISVLRTDLEKAKDNIAKKDHYQDQVNKMKVQIKKDKIKIKSNFEVPLILEKISKIADENKVRIDQIMPNPMDQEEVLKAGDGSYYAFPITIKAKCGYHNFGRFLNALEKTDVFLKVSGFNILAATGSQLHAVDLNLAAIVFEAK